MSGHGHSHGSAGGPGSSGVHAGATHRWRLRLSFALITAFFGVELAAGLTSGSLALVSDAGHMAADVVALGAALVATRMATRRDRTGLRTFGSYRAEVFASGLAVLLMVGVSLYIAVEAVGRVGTTGDPATGVMMVVGGLGLVINLVALLLLRGGAAESLNVKGAYLEVLADTVGSVGVIAAGVLVQTTRAAVWDTAVALAIAVFVAFRAVMLGREVLAVLGQHAPSGIHPDDAASALAGVPGVQEVHDVHLWSLTSGMNVATAHLVTAPETDGFTVLQQARAVMQERFSIEHATLQVEPAGDAGCREITW